MTDAVIARTGPDHRAALCAATFGDVLRSAYTGMPPQPQGQKPGRRTGARELDPTVGRKRGLGKAPAARQGPVQPDDRQRPYGPARISSGCRS